ncbi:MAG: ROK family protein, partial [Acidimicrobiales bacterium]
APAVALFDAAGRGEPAAMVVRDRFADDLAAAVWLVALTVDPDAIVLGGGVAEARLVLVPGGVPVGALGAALLAADPVRDPSVLEG